jgi:rhodanese-related sulfurtransferase
MEVRRFAVFGLLVFLLTGLACAQVEPPRKLAPEELKGMIEKKEKFFFLDVREPDELEKLGTLPGYVNIPLSQLESRLSEVPRDRLIVSTCNRARRAATAAEILRKNGYKQILLCAMNDWKDKRYEVIYPKAAEKK